MENDPPFDLTEFLPYVLNLAGEQSSLGFQAVYRRRYGMLRTEWRVLFHLGRYGAMTAKDICDRARIHKTKVSRAVAALEDKQYLTRTELAEDRRHEVLALTPDGQDVFQKLCATAQDYDRDLAAQFTPQENEILRRCLKQLAQL